MGGAINHNRLSRPVTRRMVANWLHRLVVDLPCGSWPSEAMQTYDVVIAGAGAAGMMCAIEAGRRGRSVLVVDHAQSPGEKIRISGGGRCNFTNTNTAPDRFLSANPRFAISA